LSSAEADVKRQNLTVGGLLSLAPSQLPATVRAGSGVLPHIPVDKKREYVVFKNTMRTYIIRRLLLMIPTVILVTIIVFFGTRLIPGDVIDALQSTSMEEFLDRDQLTKAFGLDVSLPYQYGRWLGILPQADGTYDGLLQGSLGKSWWSGQTVGSLIATKWPVTLELGLLSLLFAQLIALPIGAYSALRQDSFGDFVARSAAILMLSVPGFWLGTMVILFPSMWWGYMPPIMYVRFVSDPLRNLEMLVVPSLILGMSMSGMTMRMTRTMMLEVLRQDYVRTAWSKGLKEGTIVRRHALKNAMIPVVSIIGLQLPVLVGGAVVIEEIFSLPGMGRLTLNAVTLRDYPLATGALLLFTIVLLMINLLTDISYALLDPRVQYR
jgi:peptide/nickel transport system permease protein